MKKLLLAVPLVAGASWAGASLYSSTQTHSAYDQLLTQLNELKPLVLVNESYSAGFLNSTAVTKVMESAAQDAKVLFRLQHDINHSPVAVIDSNVRIAAASVESTLLNDGSLSESAVKLVQGFVDAEPFQISTEVGFDGNIQNQLLISAYQHQEDGVALNFGGLDYNADVLGDSIKGSGNIGEITVEGDGKLLNLGAGVITTDLTRISQALYTGNYGIEFDQLTVSSGQGMPLDVVLESIDVNSDTTVENGQLTSRGSIHVGKIDSPLPLTSASLDVGISNISISGIKQYMEAINQLPVTDSMLSANPEMMDTVVSAFVTAIGPETGLNYKLKLNNEGGSANLDFGISVIEESSSDYPADGLASITTVRDVLNVTQLEAHLDADAAAIDQTPLVVFLTSRQAQQVVVADGKNYKADITLKNLIMDINGNPLSLETMMGEMLDMPLMDVINM